MAVIAVMTFAGLALIDMPLALVLSIIAGLFTFIPLIGPLISAVPAMLVGLLEGPSRVLTVAAVFLIVQLIESNLIEPVVEHRVVALPPAAVLAAQVIMALLFGFAGILISTPLTVVVIVAMQLLYVEDTLGDHATALGSDR
jgi:predicted PurR-regulated permease PerM